MCGGISAAALIRSGYVKLLGVSFFWRCFVLGAVACSSWPGLGACAGPERPGHVLHEAVALQKL
jgi:hypothetical protein